MGVAAKRLPSNVSTFSCAAGPACRSQFGTTAAAPACAQTQGAICSRRDGVTLGLHGAGVGGGPKPGRVSCNVKLDGGRISIMGKVFVVPGVLGRELREKELAARSGCFTGARQPHFLSARA